MPAKTDSDACSVSPNYIFFAFGMLCNFFLEMDIIHQIKTTAINKFLGIRR